MNNRIHLFIAKLSVIRRSDIATVLKRLGALNIDIAEASDIGS